MSNKVIMELVESQQKAVLGRRNELVKKWDRIIRVVDESFKSKRGKGLADIERYNLAQCLENALENAAMRGRSRIYEATSQDAIDFLPVQLQVIGAMLPSLALNEVASVQALDRRSAGIFYLDVTYGTAKGAQAVGDTMLSSLTGHNRTESGRLYASTLVVDEKVTTTNAGTYPLKFKEGIDVTTSRREAPEKTIVVKKVQLNTAGEVVTIIGTYTDQATPGVLKDGSGNTVATVTTSGLVVPASPNTLQNSTLLVSYSYRYDAAGLTGGVPEADFKMAHTVVEAIDFPIRSRYSLSAAIDLQRAHGIDLESEVTKFLGGEIRFTIDHLGIDLIDKAACGLLNVADPFAASANMTPAASISDWNARIVPGQEWVWKKNEILDRFEQGNINIINKTLRAVATFIIAGNNVARVIKQLPNFKPASLGNTPPTGPYKMGELDGRVVIHDPFLADRTIGGTAVLGANRYIMGYKGDSYLKAGFVYAPYIPLMSTPVLVTSDLYAQTGFLSSAGFKVVNAGMFCYGTISNLGQIQTTFPTS